MACSRGSISLGYLPPRSCSGTPMLHAPMAPAWRSKLCIVATVALLGSRPANSDGLQKYEPGLGISLGAGWDTLRGLARGTAVTGTAGTSLVMPGKEIGAREQVKIWALDTESDFETMLQSRFEVGGRIGVFSLSSKLESMRSIRFDSRTRTLAITIPVSLVEAQYKDPQFTADASALLQGASPAVPFYLTYGDRYINSIIYGGMYIGFVSLTASSKAKEDSLKGEFGGGLLGWSLNASFESKLKTLESRYEITISEDITGPVLKPATSVEGVYSNAVEFTQKVTSAAYPIAFATTDYRTIPGFTRKNIPPVIDEDAEREVPELSARWREYATFARRLSDVLDNRYAYKFGATFPTIDNYVTLLQDVRAEEERLSGALMQFALYYERFGTDPLMIPRRTLDSFLVSRGFNPVNRFPARYANPIAPGVHSLADILKLSPSTFTIPAAVVVSGDPSNQDNDVGGAPLLIQGNVSAAYSVGATGTTVTVTFAVIMDEEKQGGIGGWSYRATRLNASISYSFALDGILVKSISGVSGGCVATRQEQPPGEHPEWGSHSINRSTGDAYGCVVGLTVPEYDFNGDEVGRVTVKEVQLDLSQMFFDVESM